MKKRKIQLATVLCTLLAIVILASGCKHNETKKLRICFDVGSAWDMTTGTSTQQLIIESFLKCLTESEESGGISPEEVEIEIIPSDESLSTERSATLQRIRTEIMTGGGPDIFVCACDINDLYHVQDERLFPYAEIAMENDFFLPLDDYLDDFERSPWSEMNHNIMAGGKNQEGHQVLLPMTYTLPLVVFYQDELTTQDFSDATWNDVLSGEDTILAEQIRWFWNLWDGVDNFRKDFHESGIAYVYPELVDKETKKLNFTEDALLKMITSSLAAYQRIIQSEFKLDSYATLCHYDVRQDNLFDMSNRDLTVLPLRNQQGGATAVVTTYCAVNRNIKQADKAIAILDILLGEGMWLNSDLVTVYNFPVNQRILIERNADLDPNSFFASTGLTENSFQEFLKAVNQVNAVRLPSRLDYTLNDMLLEIQGIMEASHADVANDPLYAQRADFILGDINDEELEEIVHKYYMKLCRLVDES